MKTENINNISNTGNTSLEPHMSANDKIMFYKYLSKSTFYFEYGSGGSTIKASEFENIKSIYTVESDLEWIKKIKMLTNNDDNYNINYVYIDMKTKPKTWGNPGIESTFQEKKYYSEYIKTFELAKFIDLILIDGRFRVACALKCFDVISIDCVILVDDFYTRPTYNILLDFYDIIEYTEDKRMIALKKKYNIDKPNIILIEKYEKDML
jgi:hypothetical protein